MYYYRVKKYWEGLFVFERVKVWLKKFYMMYFGYFDIENRFELVVCLGKLLCEVVMKLFVLFIRLDNIIFYIDELLIE